MPRYIAFLRGINVSGQKLIRMEDLREHFKLSGFNNIVTYIQSGNVLFDTSATDEPGLVGKIRKRLKSKTGFDIPVALRTLDEIREVIARNPYGSVKKDDPKKLYVSFLAAVPDAKLTIALEAFNNERESVQVIGREVYLLTGGYADTRFSNTFVEKKLAASATTRNWATVNKILDL